MQARSGIGMILPHALQPRPVEVRNGGVHERPMGIARERLQPAEQRMAAHPQRERAVGFAQPRPEFGQIEMRHDAVLGDGALGLCEQALHLLRGGARLRWPLFGKCQQHTAPEQRKVRRRAGLDLLHDRARLRGAAEL
jgi:hypothetical protein